jgi:BlaI family penicillinase repressor
VEIGEETRILILELGIRRLKSDPSPGAGPSSEKKTAAPLTPIIYSGKFTAIDDIPNREERAMGETQLGRMQLRIMQVLWDRGRASAREITEALNEAEPVAHSTVQTLLRQLEAKGAVGHEAVNRTFVFLPRLKEDKVKRTAAREVLERVFGGDVGNLVAYLLKGERLSLDELDELHRLIDRHHND